MKILKSIISTVIILILFICIVGCNKNNYSTYIVDVANDEISGDIDISNTQWSEGYFERNATECYAVIFDENEYSGFYQKSLVNKCNSFITDIYKNDDGIEFGIRSDDNSLVHINFMNKSFFDTEPYLPEIDNARENAVNYAKNIASKYVNINEYEMIEDEPITRYKEKDGKKYEITYYNVMFSRKINGINTSDYISIKITSKGHLASLIMGDINAFKDVISPYNASLVDASITDTVKNTYSKLQYQMYDVEVESQILAITPAGKLVLYSQLGVDIVDEYNYHHSTAIAVITELD